MWRQALAIQADHPGVRLHLSEFLVARGGPDDLAQAAELLARGLRDGPIVCMQARVAALRGRCDEADQFDGQCQRAARRAAPRSGEIAALRGDCRFAAGEFDAAAERFAQASAAGFDTTGRAAALAAARTRIHARATPRDLQAQRDARVLAREVLDRIARGDEPPAGDLAQRVAAAPTEALGQLALGELHGLRGEHDGAELRLLRALQLGLAGPDRARALVALGRTLLRAAPSPRRAEAAAHLAAALDEAPLPFDVHWDLVSALRATGQLRAAHTALQRLLRHPERLQSVELRDATALLRALTPALASEPPADIAPANDLRAEAARLAAQDRTREAVASLQAALARAPRQTELWIDLAGYLHAIGQATPAIDALDRALELEPDRSDLRERIGRWLFDTGRTARAHAELARAVAAGRADLDPLLVRIEAGDADAGPWADAWQRAALQSWVARLDAAPARSPAAASDARALRDTLGARADRARWPWWVGVVLVVAAAALAARWRFGGADLRALLEREPALAGDVQRVLAAIRHEVLKHNTLRLGDLAAAVERGDGPVARALTETLVGGSGEAARDVLYAHCAQLERLGRAAGVRLNLAHRDAAITPLLQGFAVIGRWRAALARADRLGSGARRRAARAIRRAAGLLNHQGYEAVRGLLDRLRLLRVDAALVVAAFDRARGEAAFAQETIAPLEVEAPADPLWVAAPRLLVDEVLVNLFRNALAASQGQLPIAIAARIGSETADVTALEAVTIAIVDRAPGALSAADLASRPVDRGLGLVRSSLAAADGSLAVAAAASPWRKAVVVKLPRAFPGEA